MTISVKPDAVSQLEELLRIAKENFSVERYTLIEKMYEELQDRILVAPASAVTYYHNAYAGGYLDHILNVIKASMKVSAAFKAMGGEINFTKEELIFAAMHHDLGKLGDMKHPYYVPNPSDWHIKNRGELYSHTPDIQFMKVTDRALFLLQQFGIAVTQNEWIAIKLSDGLYEKGNESYLMNPTKFPMKCNLLYIVHWADHLSSVAERDQYRMSLNGTR